MKILQNPCFYIQPKSLLKSIPFIQVGRRQHFYHIKRFLNQKSIAHNSATYPRRLFTSSLFPRTSSDSREPSSQPSSSQPSSEILEPPKRPSYQLTFTCKPCDHRSSHEISKHGYHAGTVLITCPQCKNRHVISDHLRVGKIFTVTSYY